jgi:hypothetical protein
VRGDSYDCCIFGNKRYYTFYRDYIMKITYTSDDGVTFDTEIECAEHEEKVAFVNGCMDILRPIPSEDDFERGKSSIQQDPKLVKNIMLNVMSMLPESFYPKEMLSNTFLYRRGMISRSISDGGDKYRYIKRVWYRFMCMDDNYCEWSQLYFALEAERK